MGRWKGGTPGQEELAKLGTVPQLCGFRQIAYHSELRQAFGRNKWDDVFDSGIIN